MSGTCPTSTPSPPSPTLTLTPIPPTPSRPTWPFSLPTILSTPSLDSVRAVPPVPTTMVLSIAMLFMTTILLLWRSSRNRSRARRATIQRLHRRLEEANSKQTEYEALLEQEREASRRREEEQNWAQEERRKAEDERRRVVEEKRKLEQDVRALRNKLEEKEKQKALLQVGILKLKRKAEAVTSELDDARREVERRAEQLERLVEQATPFLELLRIDLDVDLPSTIQPPAPPSPSSSTAVQTRAGKAPLPKSETDPDELLPKSLLTSLNNHISSLSAKLADEGVRVIREVEDALDEADKWVDAMHREEVRSLEEGSELEVDSDRDRDKASPSQGRRASPQQQQKGVKQAKETPPRSQIPVPVSSPMYFPPTERRLTESPRSLHEVELPPVGPPPRGPLPPIPPSPPRAPVVPPKPSSIPRPLSTASDSRMRAPSSALSQPRPFSAPVQSSPPRHQRASPPPALPLSGSALQKPPRTTPPDLQHSPPTQYMYPYPNSNQQQPMGIPVSLAKGFGSSASASARQSPSSAPQALPGSTSTHRPSKPSSRSSSAASLVPFPTSSSSSLAGAKPSSISSAQWERLGPYDRQVLIQAQRERAEREREARLEARRLAKQEAKRRHRAEREALRREREAAKAEREKRRKEEQAKREEAVEARVQAGEVFGEGLVGMLKEAGVRRGVFTEKVERKASTPTPKASLNGGKKAGSGEGGSGEGGGGDLELEERGSGSKVGGGDGSVKDSGKDREEEKGEEKEAGGGQSGKLKIDLHTTLKLAFQTALCAYTHWMMCSWFFEDERGGVAAGNGAGDAGGHEGGEGLEGLLGEVYARVREGEEQLVSGLWRALTRKHVQRMLPGASSGSSSKRSSKDSERQGKLVAGENGEESEEEDDGRPDTLIEELCIYIIDALVNVLIVSGAHGGWYVGSGDEDVSEEDIQEVDEEEEGDDDDGDDDSGEDIILFPAYQHPTQQTTQHSSPHIVPMEVAALGGGDYNPDPIDLDSDLYHDPYQGYSISQLSEFLSVTPTSDTFKIGGRRGQTGQVLPGNVLLQGQPLQRPHARSRSPPQSHFPSSSPVPQGQRPQRTSASPNTRPRPRRSRSATRLQAHSESTSKYTQEYLHAHLTAAFKVPLMRILKKARVLNKVLGEEVVRCDLEALYVAPGVGFVGDMMERGIVDPVGSHAEKEDVEPESGQELEASADADLNDDGEDTPRPASSPNSKRGTGGKASSQPTGVAASVGAGVPELPPQLQGGSPERSSQVREVEPGSPHEQGSEEAEILCTTQLGLVRAEKVPRTRGEWDEVVLVKPVVILMRDLVSA